MDIKVYHKETVPQPNGSIDVLVPDTIDIFPHLSDDNLELKGCDVLEDKDEVLQSVVLATIFQKGLDPVDSDDGVQWSESLIGEVTVPQLITQLQDAVSQVSDTSSIEFSTVNVNGKELLTYKLKAV